MRGYKIMCRVWTADRYDYINGEYNGVWFKKRETAQEKMLKAQQKHKDNPAVEFYIEEVTVNVR